MDTNNKDMNENKEKVTNSGTEEKKAPQAKRPNNQRRKNNSRSSISAALARTLEASAPDKALIANRHDKNRVGASAESNKDKQGQKNTSNPNAANSNQRNGKNVNKAKTETKPAPKNEAAEKAATEPMANSAKAAPAQPAEQGTVAATDKPKQNAARRGGNRNGRNRRPANASQDKTDTAESKEQQTPAASSEKNQNTTAANASTVQNQKAASAQEPTISRFAAKDAPPVRLKAPPTVKAIQGDAAQTAVAEMKTTEVATATETQAKATEAETQGKTAETVTSAETQTKTPRPRRGRPRKRPQVEAQKEGVTVEASALEKEETQSPQEKPMDAVSTADGNAKKQTNNQRRRQRGRRKASPVYEVEHVAQPGLPEVQAFEVTPVSELPQNEVAEKKTSRFGKNAEKKPSSRFRNGGRSATLGVKETVAPEWVDLPLASTQPVLKTEEEVQAALLNLLEEANVPLSRDSILRHMNVNPQALLDGVLLHMLERGEIFLSKKRKYALPSQLGYLIGRIQVTTRGFGFLIPDDESGDVFIAQKALNGALNGDRVVVRLLEPDASSREGEVVSVREHVNNRIIGTLEKVQGGFVVRSDNSKLGEDFFVSKGELGGAKNGQKVVADIDYSTGEPMLAVKEVLGYPDEAGTDILSILRAHDIPEEFPPYVLRSARAVSQEVSLDDIWRREDLRNWTVVTIDGADSKDFDDAISLHTLENGNYLLGVHIADVCHYVKENGSLDKEAYRRATSVYLVDRVVPMIPAELSNGICSLNPGVDRLTLSCFMEIDSKGRVKEHRIAETVINSNERLVYEDVTALLQGDEEQRERYKELVPTLEQMQTLAIALRQNRERRGSLDFDLPETKIQVDAEGKPIQIGYVERGFANKLIEEFMLIANETVAQHMTLLNLPMIYRVHEEPDEDRISELNLFLGSLGYSIRAGQNGLKPKQVQTLLAKAKGAPEESIVSRVVLRSLKKARYHENSLGHFGLAAEYYCHFTSPIRRYPDLEVHRMVKDTLRGQMNEKRQETLFAELPSIAEHCSEREREAMGAERDVEDLKKAEYLAQHVGEVYEGIVSGVTSFGLFVALPNTCEGMVRISEIGDDYYSYDEKNYRIVGRNSGRIYQLGAPVTITVRQVNIPMRQVDFSLLPSRDPRGRRPKKNVKARS